MACSAAQKANFQSYISGSYRLILPSNCDLTESAWTGIGYFAISSTQLNIGALITGGLKGGFSSSPQLPTPYVSNTFSNTPSPAFLQYSTGNLSREPIDMTTGDYLYSNDDMKVGVGSYPHALTFQKLYSSSARLQAGPLGKGWSHNFAASTTVGSDGFQGMGEDSALDAVTTLVELMVSFDLLSDTAKPLDKLVIAILGQRWFGDQLINNTVIVRQGLNGEVFVKLPDGNYNPPPGNPARLILNGDTTYTYETLTRDRLNFNTAGKLATYNHASGLQVKFTYTGNDLTQVQNSLGRTLTLTNVSGRVTAVGDGTRSIGYAYDGNGNLQTFTDAAAKATTFQYDVPGRLTKFFYPANPSTAYTINTYDTLSRVNTQTSANGKLFTYYFAGSRSEEVGPYSTSNVTYADAFGKVLRAINPLGKVTLNTYDGQERLAKTVLPEGNSVTYVYDDAPCAAADKRCTHNVKTLSRIPKTGSGLTTLVTAMTYESAFNKVATVTDPKGFVTDYTYTAQGDPLTISRPPDVNLTRPFTTYGYTGYIIAGLPTFYLPTSVTFNTTEYVNVTNTTGYNSANKYVPLTTTADFGTGRLNLVTTYTYDTVGNPTVINGPRTDVSDVTTIAYDNQRRAIQVTDALGKLTKLAYDADGNLIRSSAQIGALWLVSCNTYTPSDKLLKAWGPGQTAADATCPTAAAPVAVADYVYDDQDRLFRTTQNLTVGEGGNRVTETTYNLDGSVLNTKRAVGTALAQTYAAYTYTNNGLPATVKDAKNNLTTYQYDGHDRLAKMLYPDKVTAGVSSTTDYEQYGYDNNGNIATTRKRDAQTITNTYDSLNRLVRRSYPGVPNDLEDFTYDARDRLTGTSAFLIGDYQTYVYDNAGRPSKFFRKGNLILTYEYDAAGNRTSITWPEATPFYVTTAYDALNRPTNIKELGTTNLATYAYDDLSRRTTVTLGNGTTTSYGYNTQSALSSLTQDLAGTAQDNTWTYSHNQAQEIISPAWSNNTYQWTGYTNGTKAYTPNGLNQYTVAAGATLSYDSNGNLTGDGTWTYGYDARNRMKSAAKTGFSATLAYDALDRFRQTTIAGTTTNLLYDGDRPDLVAEYDGSNTLLRRYIYGPGIDEPLVWYESSGTGSKTWLYGDHLGSIAATADSAGISTATYTYGPFGEPNVTTGVRFRYTGQQLLGQLGLYYYKARFYSPSLGRFLQTDPVGYGSDLNLYAYVGNDPVNNIDPDGNVPIFIGPPIIGGVINAGFEGYGASQAGASAYEIAAAAGKGFISGFAGTAAGFVTRSPAVAGAIGGGVENVINSGLSGKIPNPPDVVTAAGIGGVLGKGAGLLLPPVKPDLPIDIYKAQADFRQNVNTNATRLLDQTIGTSLAGGGIQTVGGFVNSLPRK
ncbi:RHS repeat-associated core domain-containing protein [Nitrosospira sp. Nsp11]|uniref:RHS repeat-associated core domain-containing protein n=1 Tax=Nitrosospira sp. Nsp11 TaxID=1855338 RepID=UPI00091F05F1|nr:RHS repeat-associated core domain-containing protein [Nitrosospira sp. Nsp11]SHL71090.1 RHS repeat-associated core domain-containing protein [Nitrosospira sp. Nsp11]